MLVNKVGFTGTRRYLTPIQYQTLETFLRWGHMSEFHHGDCVGADAQAHYFVWTSNTGLGEEDDDRPAADATKIIVHPPDDDTHRAFVKNIYPGTEFEHWEEKPYLERNHDIVDATDMIIACPGEPGEQLRSGTWATIRYARQQGKLIVMILPEGQLVFDA